MSLTLNNDNYFTLKIEFYLIIPSVSNYRIVVYHACIFKMCFIIPYESNITDD